MSLDLKKHGVAIKKACQEVTNDKTDINWALFGYEGQSYTLKVMSTGDDGLEELVGDFNPSQIQYAFLKVEDPKTSLPKFVLINWQGESAPGSRKGACARHVPDLEKFLAGHHMTISVRNEDELDIDLILEKVAKCTVSQFNFKEKPTGMDHSPKPVGTAHKKINPQAELPSLRLREEFWEKDQSDEKMRQLVDREKKVKEQREGDEARTKREEKEKTERDNKINEKEKVVNAQRVQEESASKGNVFKEREAWEKQRTEDARDSEERSRRSEAMRKERNQEAKELVQQRDGDAKKVFQRNSSQGQMNFSKPISPGVISTPPAFNANNLNNISSVVNGASAAVVETPDSNDNEVINSDIAPPPPAFDTSVVENLHHACPVTISEEAVEHEVEESPEVSENSPVSAGLDSYGVCAVALYDYQASDETEISFDPGQIISHIDQIDPGWWQGLGPCGNYGLFPANYVEIIDNKELQVM